MQTSWLEPRSRLDPVRFYGLKTIIPPESPIKCILLSSLDFYGPRPLVRVPNALGLQGVVERLHWSAGHVSSNLQFVQGVFVVHSDLVVVIVLQIKNLFLNEIGCSTTPPFDSR